MTARRANRPASARDAGLRARIAAIEILLRVENHGGFADALLGACLPEFAPADRRLITRLVLGTIAWRGRLDHELEHLAERRLNAISPEALEILRMGLFQIRFLDRIPRHAAVDTAVSIAKRIVGARNAAGFVNAVMRRAAREPVIAPPPSGDEAGRLAIVYSHPRWLAQRFIEWFGAADAERLMAANNEAAPNAIRLNLARAPRAEIIRRLADEGFKIGSNPLQKQASRAPEMIVLDGAPNFESRAWRDGLFHPQSEASQLIARMLAPRTGATILDCAAAPGGKATHLAELAGPAGRVIALDLNFAGLRHARAVARRLRHRNLAFVRADAATAMPFRPASIGYVLLDAPCTGLGTLREHPEIRWRIAPGDPARMAAIQFRMLANAAVLVRPGGALVYSVCSLAPEEGEGVIENFLKCNDEFAIDRKPPNHAELAGLFDARGMMKTRPDRDGLDGFFAVRLVRLT
jgi:16S rRNA (cytosine967-C5)-methyltransferase